MTCMQFPNKILIFRNILQLGWCGIDCYWIYLRSHTRIHETLCQCRDFRWKLCVFYSKSPSLRFSGLFRKTLATRQTGLSLHCDKAVGQIFYSLPNRFRKLGADLLILRSRYYKRSNSRDCIFVTGTVILVIAYILNVWPFYSYDS